MNKVLRPLRLLAHQRQSLILSASPILLPATRHDGIEQHLNTGDEVEESLRPQTSGDESQVNRNESSADAQDFTKSTLSQKVAEPIFIETTYGLRLEIPDEGQLRMRVLEATAQHLEDRSSDSNDDRPAGLHYRLFPDWQTSYLWYDSSQNTMPDDDEGPDVDLDVIKERYPSLSPYYETWRQVYETEFEKQECHLGSSAEVFPDRDDRIVWDVEGFLLACWLVLRPEVRSVEYAPRSATYVVEKNNINNVALTFLQDLAGEMEITEKVGG
ncbi:hypothetical protein P153DRAFT_387314 [Dothidotthia symphoricarpi CBS 119687]|uniref:Uncharacterized protein n=1 Tax=Dothidotthia symphoricarpi CBS 119687 TaxID=1392245 RepID=A0A6A6A6G0_9PLEO|nr:uncharacterized protein P153DRAFT_387314 [Dothidotthia symphoricarpi CBS 119687]KAF2127572.1 hypothetical protein P153DRAFT_387314 [Dothidotthia symphoricarpi CBS 119687]